MREIKISTDVYAAIWRERQPDEETEDEILSRFLGVQKPQGGEAKSDNLGDGFYDARNAVHFPEGSKIFRSFKGIKYEAEASKGAWQLVNNGLSYKSLNRLTWAVTDNSVNAWEFWKYEDSNGKERKINDLRSEDVVMKRR